MNGRTRITCVISSLGAGGAERNMAILAQYLSDIGHQVTILTMDEDVDDFFPNPPGVARARLSQALYKMTCRWFDVCCQLDRWRHLREEILKTRPAVVISFLDQVNIQVVMSLRGSGIPVIASVRTDPRKCPITWRWGMLRLIAYTFSFRIVFVSKSVTDWARRMRPWWKGQWIPNPIFFDRAHEGAEGAMQPVVRPKIRTIFGLGRLSEEKGFDLLIEAFSRIADKYPDWCLKIIGDGPLRTELTRMIEHKRLVGRVQLLGRVFPPFNLLRQGDLFVLSSRFEGFPNILLEAMGCGLPAVSFDCQSGPSEIIRQDVDGILVPPDDEIALADAMERLMADESQRLRMARNAPEVLNRFSKERTMKLWEQLIDDALQARSSIHSHA
jgi:glycosyltransferase involved in cell wall biosynthesis